MSKLPMAAKVGAVPTTPATAETVLSLISVLFVAKGVNDELSTVLVELERPEDTVNEGDTAELSTSGSEFKRPAGSVVVSAVVDSSLKHESALRPVLVASEVWLTVADASNVWNVGLEKVPEGPGAEPLLPLSWMNPTMGHMHEQLHALLPGNSWAAEASGSGIARLPSATLSLTVLLLEHGLYPTVVVGGGIPVSEGAEASTTESIATLVVTDEPAASACISINNRLGI